MKRTMKHFIRLGSGLAIAFALLAASGDASAAGSAMEASELSAKVATDLRADIAKARADAPEHFRAVLHVTTRAKQIDEMSRMRGAPFTLQFKSMGNKALMPMLEQLAFDSKAARDLPETAASALKLGMIEAVGIIRDARSIPVMARLLERDVANMAVQRAATEALARLGTDDALHVISDALTKAQKANPGGSALERTLLSGMHDCRREAAARVLANRIDAKPDADTAKVIARSLGGVGNAWAWKTIAQTEMGATRALAAQKLVEIFVSYSGDVREQAAKSLLIVDDASTSSLIAKAKRGASQDNIRALDDLDKLFANNPTR